MYKCMCCGEVFEESEVSVKEICYEDYYGVADLFHSRNYVSMYCCPYCESEIIEYYTEDEEDEKEA